ncbi:WD repeat-containing protein 18 [Pogonomyrmex barbatus]|uniref:WD repeat-containing protein 18 n=1 Tax=Pogonomyrmex barbatus TaxID=144034 RepID=A0A6I9VV86_9HYME|nr:WD repeat-containing protein 18 [Pogonomyrmex barbatus]
MSRITDAKEVILTSDTTGENWSAAVWDPRNGSLLSVYKNATALGHRSLQLLSDGYVLGASATRPFIHIWPLNNPSPLPHVRLTTPGKVSALTCTPNGSYIIVSASEKLFIWQTCNGRLMANLTKHYQTVNCLAVTKDGSLFASAGEDGLVLVWSLYSALNDNNCSPVHTFNNHNLPVKDLYFSHGGARARLYTVSLDRTANVYELGSGDLLLSLVFNVPLTAIAVSIRESDLFVGCTTGEIFQCNLHEPPRGIERHVTMGKNADEDSAIFRAHKSNVTALSVSMDCHRLLSGSTDNMVHIWDIISRQVLKTLEHKGPITAAFFARGFENFRVPVLKPRLRVHNLQTISENDGGKGVVEVVSRGRNATDILNFEYYVKNNSESDGLCEVPRELENTQREIMKLKKINAAMYQYHVTHLLNDIIDDE